MSITIGPSGQLNLLEPVNGPSVSVYIYPETASEGDLSVQVVAGSNVAFEVVRVGVGVVGAGVGTGLSSPVSVLLAEPLILGERYVARATGQPLPLEYAFECVRRYGHSEALADGTMMQPFFFLTGAATGNWFNIHLALIDANAPPVPRQFAGELLIGFRLPTDPVLPLLDGRYLLAPTFSAPVMGWVQANAVQGGVFASVPIPQGVSGFVFLVQFVIYEGNEFRLSQIYGAPIH